MQGEADDGQHGDDVPRRDAMGHLLPDPGLRCSTLR